jgi:hypothetical protein
MNMKFTTLAAGLLLGSLSLPSLAYNVTVGAACEASEESTPYIYKSSGRLQNYSGTTQTVYCPVYNMGAFSSKTITATLVVVDQHSSQDVSCDLVVTYSSGTGGTYVTQKTSGSSWSPQYLAYNISSFYNGGAYLRCTMPNQTQILNYRSN